MENLKEAPFLNGLIENFEILICLITSRCLDISSIICFYMKLNYLSFGFIAISVALQALCVISSITKVLSLKK